MYRKQRRVSRRRSENLRRVFRCRTDWSSGVFRCRTGWSSRTMTTCTRRVGRFESHESLTAGTVVAASGLNEVTEFACLLLNFVGLVSGDEQMHVIHDSVADCMCFGSGDGFATLCATAANFHLTGAPVVSSTNSILIRVSRASYSE
jgi:hypothetical protein